MVFSSGCEPCNAKSNLGPREKKSANSNSDLRIIECFFRFRIEGSEQQPLNLTSQPIDLLQQWARLRACAYLPSTRNLFDKGNWQAFIAVVKYNEPGFLAKGIVLKHSMLRLQG